MNRKPVAALLLVALLLSGCAAEAPSDPYALTLWLCEGDALTPALTALAEDYNRERDRDALAVSVRSFESEEQLLAALQSGAAPGLCVLASEDAEELERAHLLYDPGIPPFDGGFCSLGVTVPLLCAAGDAPSSLTALLEAAARGEISLFIGAFAPVFGQGMLEAQQRFTADFELEAQNESYVNLYNLIAGAAFTGGLTDAEDAPYRIERSTALAGRELSGYALSPLAEDRLFSEGVSLAVTAREARMRRAVPAFLHWLLEGDALPAAALEAGMIPVLGGDPVADSPLDETLLSLRGAALSHTDVAYRRNAAAFDKRLREALSLLR